MIRVCKDCKDEYSTYSSLQTRCPKCQYARDAKKPKPVYVLKQRKPIAQKGKKTIEYEKWRDIVARPYLDEKYGIGCFDCGILPPLKPYSDTERYRHDVAHIVGRGRDITKKMVLTNVRYKCRRCHQAEDIVE